MPDPGTRNALMAGLGLVWCAVVLASYYAVNAGYYEEKVGVFARFLFGLSG